MTNRCAKLLLQSVAKFRTMNPGTCAVARLPLCLALVWLVAACSSKPPTSPDLVAQCTAQHRLWMKYQAAENPSNNPQRATVDLALYRCQNGDSKESIPDLEKTLRRDLIPVPP